MNDYHLMTKEQLTKAIQAKSQEIAVNEGNIKRISEELGIKPTLEAAELKRDQLVESLEKNETKMDEILKTLEDIEKEESEIADEVTDIPTEQTAKPVPDGKVEEFE